MKTKLTSLLVFFCTLFLIQCGSSSTTTDEVSTTTSNAQANSNISYRGLWAPSITVENSHDTDDPTYLSNNGFNLVSVIANVVVDANGDITTYTDEFELDAVIQRYQAQNFQILLSVALVYSEDGTMDNMSGATTFQSTTSVDIESVLDAYEPYVSQFAAYAEENNIEIFVPMNEADLTLGTPTDEEFVFDYTLASNWGQEILETIETAGFTGKVLWKSGMDYSNIDWDLDLTGYDMVGVSISPSEVHRSDLTGLFAEDVERIITKMNTAASEDGVPETLVSEFGAWGLSEAWEDSEYAQIYETVFSTALNSVDGFIAFDNLAERNDGSLIYGTAVEDVIQSYFLESND